MDVMWSKEQWRRWSTTPAVEWSLFALGVVLILLAPLVGVLPGPGGTVVFAIGLAFILRTSMWAKRRYVHFKRWQPRVGRFTDWGLRIP